MEQELLQISTQGLTPNLNNSLNTGVDRVLEYDNIAIVVLMVFVLFQAILIGILLRGLLKTKDVLYKLATSITILNERLNSHHD